MDFASLRILVVGDAMLDQYIAGDVGRISPEAPVVVASVRKRWGAPGGAGNVARNLARLGVSATIVGLTGGDAAGENLSSLLGQEGVHDALLSANRRKTTCKTRIIARGQQLLRLDEEDVSPLEPPLSQQLRERILDLLPAKDAVILSDYGKGVLLESPDGGCLCPFVISEAGKRGIPVLVDPKGGSWERYHGAQCATPNASEFALACGADSETHMDRRARETHAAMLRKRFSLENLLLTRGAKGMALFSREGPPCYIRAAVHEVADVSGAGDTVIAVLAACVARGLGWEESARIANAAAGVAVSKMGTAPVSLFELNQAIGETAANPKLFQLDALMEKIEDWRRKDETIVFTNGCFDLLHPGHISLINQCLSLGDHLVVGLNSDASARRLKGRGRPIQDEESRALLLSALRGVDAVTIFDADTPLELIRRIRPNVLVKGSDYTLDSVVGADIVQSYGGIVVLAQFVDGCSTTSLVSRMSSSGES